MALAQEEVWIRESSGLWSESAGWLDGSAPLPGGNPALTLRFAQPASLAGTVATDDLAGAFSLNRLVLEGNSQSTLTLTGAVGASLRFTGVDPRIELRGTGDASITLPVTLNPTSDIATIIGSGPGSLTISGAISAAAGTRLVVDTGATSPNAAVVQLSGTSAFTGGVILQSGNLLLGSSTALGTGVLTVRGGLLSLEAIGVSVANNIALESDLVLRLSSTSGSATLRGVIASATPGAGVVLRTAAGNTVSFTAASTYNGATTLDYSRAPQFATSAGGTLNLSGSGSVLQTSAFNLRAGSTLLLSGATSANRVGDSTPIHLRGGGVAMTSFNGAGTTHTETVGPLDGAGFSPITLTADTLVNTRLTAQSLARTERGTFLFRGTALGNAFAAGVGNLLFATAPSLTGGGGTGPAIGILPYAIGDTNVAGAGLGFVTYVAGTGIRPLNNTTEYRATLTTTAAGENVRLTTGQTLSAPQTINALLLDGGSIGGTGPLKVASGAILHRSGVGISAPLNFGSVEANLFNAGSFTVSGSIAGTNGLTKSGAGTLTLGAANTFTGVLTINAGLIAFGAANRLGEDISAIVVNGHSAGLSYSGTSALVFSRPIETRTGLARLDVSGTGDFAITTPIAGAGGLQISTNAGRTLTLPAGSTYTGATHLGTSRVVIPGDSALGNGGPLNLAGATLTQAGPWTTAREINVVSGVLDTAGFDATWSGVFTGTGAFEKRGAGTLRLTTPSNDRASISLTGGMLALSDGGALSGSISVSGGAELQLDQSGVIVPDRLGDRSAITLSGGKLTLIGNATTVTSERIGSLTLGLAQEHTLSLVAPGTAGMALRLAGGFTLNGGNLILRAAQLGGEAGGAYQRVLVDDPAALGAGAIPGVYADTALSGAGGSFVIYDASTDAAGPIGLRPLRAGEYAGGPALQNPANGGTTPVNANFLADSATVAAGTGNTIDTLTLGSGGSVTLANGQAVAITSGQVLARAGTSTVAGGTLQFGAKRADFYTTGELTLSSAVTGGAGLKKSGPGTLIFAGAIGYTGGTLITDGVLRPAAGDPFAGETVTINSPGVLDIGAGAFSVARLAGLGTVALGGGTLTLGVPGTDFSFAGGFSGTGRIVFSDSGNPNLRRTFSGPSTFSGEIVLDAGQLIVAGNGALGPSTWIINGGTLNSASGTTISPKLVLQADLPILGSSLTLGPGVSATGAHDVLLRSSGALNVTGAFTLEGKLGTQFGPDAFTATPGTIVVQGAAGSVTTVAGLRIEAGGGLSLSNTNFPSPAGGRLGDTTPVHLGGGNFSLSSNAAANASETFGALSSAGFSRVQLQPTGTSGAALTAASLQRVDRGTFAFQSLGTLGASAGPNVGQFFSTAAPDLRGGSGTQVNASIIPWAVGLGPSGWGLVTYGATGVRPLTSAEYAASTGAAAATTNVQLPNANFSNPTSRTINALVLNGSTLSGPGSLTIASGTVVAAHSSSITAALAFGNAEAQFFLMEPGVTDVSAPISGSGGLTRSGSGALTLAGNNSFTGPITINDGVLNFSAPQNLGVGLDPITLHGSAASLTFTGAVSLAVARPVRLAGGVSQFGAAQSTGVLQISGAISGPGGLALAGPGTIRLTGVNSYTGPTFLGTTTVINSDAAFGASSAVTIAATNTILRLAGNWTTSRRFVIPLSTTIDTNGFEAVFDAAPFGGFGATLTKAGAGAMRLRTPLLFNGGLQVAGGELRLEQDGLLYASPSVAPGAVLTLDDSGRVLSNRVSFVVLNGGELRLVGNSTAPVNERIGTLVQGENTSGTITLTTPGAAGVTLSLENFFQNSASVLFRGDNLGGPAGSAFTRIVFTNVPSFPGGLIPAALASNSATGAGATFAIYDSSSDAAGVIGVRPLVDAAYVTGPEIRNPVNGGTTPVNARFRATGPTTAGGAGNRLSLLRVSGAAAITLDPGQALTVDSGTIIADAGANASISGGTLVLPATPAQLLMAGNLSINSRVDAAVLTKTGAGTLTIGGAARWASTFNLNQGTANVAGGDALRFATVNIAAVTALNFSQLPATAGTLAGTGTLGLPAAGNLTVQSLAGTLAIGGAGGLKITSHAFVTRPVTFSGALAVTAENPLPGVTPRVTFSGNGTALNASSVRIDAGTVLHLDNYPNAIARLGVVPVELNGGEFLLTGGTNVLAQSLGTLTTRGSSTLTLNLVVAPTTLRFNGIARADRGTLHISANASYLGTALLYFPSPAPFGLIGAGTTTRNLGVVPFATGDAGFYGVVPVTFASGDGIRPLLASELSISLIAGENVQIRDSALTSNVAATVNSLSAQSDLLGTGTVTVTSGVVIGSGATRIENGLSFGAAEAILSSHQSGSLTLSGPLNGSGGLTKSGPGTIVLPAVNNIAGTLTINAGALSFSNPAQLGPGTSAIVLHSGGLQWSGAGDLVFPRAIRLLSGGLGSIGATDPAATLHLAGPITGPGGLNLTGRVVFDTAPAYTGPTQISGTLLLGSDTLLGASSQVRFNGGTLALTGPWNTAREILVLPPGAYTSTVDTAGYDAVLSGTLLGSGYLTKIGAGNLTLGDAAGFSGQLRIDGGKVILGSPGVPSSNRIHDSAVIRLAGGALEIAGYPGATREVFDDLTLTSGTISRLRLIAPGAASQILQVGVLRREGNSLAILQADRLGESEGAFTRFVISTFAPASGTFLPNVIVTDSMGQPASFAIYDGTIDDAGPVGLRAARADEYVGGPLLQNPASGGTTPTTANFRVSGNVAVAGAQASVNTLTLAGGATLAIPVDSKLTVNTRAMLTSPGPAAAITGGSLIFGGSAVVFFLGGDLAIDSALTTPGGLSKLGPATLALGGDATTGSTSIEEGTIKLIARDPLARQNVTIAPGAVLDTASRSVTVSALFGSGLVDLGSGGMLTLSKNSNFSGATRGTGTLRVLIAAGDFIGPVFTPAGPLTHAGPILVESGSLVLEGAGRLVGATAVRTVDDSTFSVRNTTGLSSSTALELGSGGTLELRPGNAALQLGSLTGHGLGRIAPKHDTESLQVDFASLSRGPEGGAVFFLDADNAGLGAAPGPGVANLRFGPGFSGNLVGGPGITPIIPFMFGAVSGDRPRLVTYDETKGVRLLLDDEYSTTPVPGSNFLVADLFEQDGTITVNTLTTRRNIEGIGTVNITGGLAILNNSIEYGLNFGARQGNIVIGSTGGVLGPIAGSGGLTITKGASRYNAAEIYLGTDNPFTGPLILNGVTVEFTSAASLGADTGPITLYSSALRYDGNGALVLNRPLHVASGIATISGFGNPIQLNGSISGPGGLAPSGSDGISITGANSYTGPTFLRGVITIGGSSPFGQTSQIEANSYSLTLANSWTESAPFRLNTGLYTINTATFDATLLGSLTSTASLWTLAKNGSGRLTIANGANFGAKLTVNAGTLELRGDFTGDITAAAGTVVTGSAAVRATVVPGNSGLIGTVSIAGTLEPGDGVGEFSAGMLILQTNSTLRLLLESATAYDRATSRNAPSLGSNINLDLQIAPGFDPVDDFDEFVLIENASTSPLLLSGLSPLVFAGNPLIEGEIFSTPGQMWRISYTGGTGNDVSIRAVPEPTAGLSFTLGLALMAGQRGRRNGKR